MSPHQKTLYSLLQRSLDEKKTLADLLIRREYAHFTKFTTGNPIDGKKNVVFMGRKTWEETSPSGCHPLKDRYNIVLSRSLKTPPQGADALVSSVDELIELLQSPEWKSKIDKVYNIGGGETTQSILKSEYCGKIYLTRVAGDFDCDTFFPNLSEDSSFKLVESCTDDEEMPEGEQIEDGIRWRISIYEKVRKD